MTLPRLRTTFHRFLRHPLLLGLYIPAVLFATAVGVIGPVLPLYAADFDVPYGVVGLVVAGEMIGTLIGDIPAGMLLGRLGKRRMMLLGLAINGVMMAGLFLVSHIVLAFVLLVASGMGWAFFGVSRHAFVAESVSIENRGRAIAVFGGTFRIGRFLGPAMGGLIAARFGLRVPFLLYGGLVGLALLVVFFFTRDTEAEGAAASGQPASAHSTALRSPLAVIREQYQVLRNAGSAQFLAQMTRAGWRTIIPLYGADVLGLDVSAIGLIVSLMSAVDMALFMPTGVIMDRWGRKFAIVPSFLLQATGLALVPLATGFAGLLGASMLIGFGNGLGAGTMMTVGADLAPEDARGEFLGVWRLIGDTGATSGPLVVGVVADALALPATALVAAFGGVASAMIFARGVPETLRQRRTMVRR